MGRCHVLFRSNFPRARNATHGAIIHVQIFANASVLGRNFETLYTELVIGCPFNAGRRFHFHVLALGHQGETWFSTVRVSVIAVSSTPTFLVMFESKMTSKKHASGSGFANNAYPITRYMYRAVMGSG